MAFVATRAGPSAAVPSDGSRTITIQDSQPREEDDLPSGDDAEPVGTLRLRGVPRTRNRNRPGVVWREDVVDNEHLGKKSSKICCIYHKPKQFDESSSEESSSDSDSDSSPCDGHDHSHDHARRREPRQPRPGPDTNGEGSTTRGRDAAVVVHETLDHSTDVNAYERQPKRKGKKDKDIANNE